jgi:hypothetical protein
MSNPVPMVCSASELADEVVRAEGCLDLARPAREIVVLGLRRVDGSALAPELVDRDEPAVRLGRKRHLVDDTRRRRERLDLRGAKRLASDVDDQVRVAEGLEQRGPGRLAGRAKGPRGRRGHDGRWQCRRSSDVAPADEQRDTDRDSRDGRPGRGASGPTDAGPHPGGQASDRPPSRWRWR